MSCPRKLDVPLRKGRGISKTTEGAQTLTSYVDTNSTKLNLYKFYRGSGGGKGKRQKYTLPRY